MEDLNFQKHMGGEWVPLFEQKLPPNVCARPCTDLILKEENVKGQAALVDGRTPEIHFRTQGRGSGRDFNHRSEFPEQH